MQTKQAYNHQRVKQASVHDATRMCRDTCCRGNITELEAQVINAAGSVEQTFSFDEVRVCLGGGSLGLHLFPDPSSIIY